MASNYPSIINYNNVNTYLANDIKDFFPILFRGIRSVRNIISKINIPNDQYFVVTVKNNLYEPTTLTYRKAKILIKQDWFDHYIQNKDYENLNLNEPRDAPALLELRDDEKFTDDDGNMYEVEVRGERHEDKIRFRGKDVETIFQMEKLLDNVQTEHTEYIKGEDYEILIVVTPTLKGQLQLKKGGHKKRLFYISRSYQNHHSVTVRSSKSLYILDETDFI